MFDINFLTNNLNISLENILSVVLTGSKRYIDINSNDYDYIVIINDDNYEFNNFKDFSTNTDYLIYGKNFLNKILFDDSFTHFNKQFLFLDFCKGYDEYIVYGNKVFEYDLFSNLEFVKDYYKYNYICKNDNMIIKSTSATAKRLYQAFNFMYIYQNKKTKLTDYQINILYLKSRNVKLPNEAVESFYEFYDMDSNFRLEYSEYEQYLPTSFDEEEYSKLQKNKILKLLRYKREPLLRAYDTYKINVLYGIENVSTLSGQNSKEEIDNWYRLILDLDPESIENPPEKIKYYL